jgi:N-acetyl-anhydromuramyl-L-alanine amidase AmpD
MEKLDTSKIKQVPLSSSEYYQEYLRKTQIVIHHTAGNSSAVNVINDWNKDARGRIATCVAISGKGAKNSIDGEIVQAFSSRFWAHHLGVKSEVFKARKLPWMNLDMLSIGIEVCNWGALDYENGKFLTYVDTVVKPEDVVELAEPFKGKKYFHKYTDAQIESVRQLLVYWSELYSIDITYDYDKMFTVNNEALTGKNGLYSHNSYRKDKIDIYPCPRMIEMLKSL